MTKKELKPVFEKRPPKINVVKRVCKHVKLVDKIDVDVVKALCGQLCTKAEIAAIVGVHQHYLDAKVKELGYTSFAEFYDCHASNAKASLRRQMYSMALDGNEKMLIKLADMYLTDESSDNDNAKSGQRMPQFNFIIKQVTKDDDQS